MNETMVQGRRFTAIISSDWNECLAPCGPFDPIVFNYPGLKAELGAIFKQYTGNSISLAEAALRTKKLLPGPLSEQQMDAYVDHSFATYNGVPDLIDWCFQKKILFMINTTGFLGYFQRVFAKGLLPVVPAISANPMIKYPASETDPPYIYDLQEIENKSKNTSSALQLSDEPISRIILIGDSGGDGPHFHWGAKQGAFLIGSMAKYSLTSYCQKKKIEIHYHFGHRYGKDETRNPERERGFDFMDLVPVIEKVLA